jgi:short-subunit dehydrogenase
MARTLEGKSALVTGASSGIGAAAAGALARRGCRVVLGARRLDRVQALASEIAASVPGAETLALHLDVTRPDEIDVAVQRTVERFGGIDLLVNNAGIGRMDWLERLDAERDIRDQVTVNLLGAIYAARAVLPTMMRQRSGHIINMGSMAGFIGSPMYSVYAASKFGLRGFSDALRREVSPWGIHVSVIYPGGVQTEFGRSGGSTPGRLPRTPRWLALTPEAVGEAVARLAARPRRSWVMPPVMLPLIWANAVFPGLIDRMAAAVLVRRQRAADLQARQPGGGKPQS